MIPIVVRVTEESLKVVPNSGRGRIFVRDSKMEDNTARDA